MNVLILAGSHRRDSWTVQVAADLGRLAPAGVCLEMYSGLEALPFYSQDLDVADPSLAPAAVSELRAAVHAADALVVVTPEYNGSLPGVLKNAIDWASRPRGASCLDSLPAAVVGVSPSPGGGRRAAADVVKVLTVAGAAVIEDPVSIASVYEVLEGGRVQDGDLQSSLAALLAALMNRANGRESSEEDAA